MFIATSTPPLLSIATSSALTITTTIPSVPFYSQFKDITSAAWQKVGCGVTSLAMVIDYYKPAVPVNTLLKQGINLGAYKNSVGWTYQGLISLAQIYGLDGSTHDFRDSSSSDALEQIKKYLADGPVIASVHYKFDPSNPIPHLVVVDGIENGVVYYNDPAANGGEKQISVTTFQKAWKKRFIVIRPAKEKEVASKFFTTSS